MVMTSEALVACRINVQRKPEWIEKVLGLDLKQTESLVRTICGSEFQTDGAKSESMPGKVCPDERLDQQRDGRWT